MISVRDLRVDYDETCAVRSISFDIEAGEVYGLIGPNGSGKTSTMRALAGLLQPTHGRIEIAGVDLLIDPDIAQQNVGFMPDFPPMYDDLLVWEFLDLFAASYFIPKPERKEVVDRHIQLVGLREKRHSFCKELSRGMRQRLMLAKTLIPNPQVLLLDEPASGMDPHARSDLKKIILGLAEAGRAVLVSSHILAEMNEFCTSIGIMERGRMVVSGRVEDVANQVHGAGQVEVRVLERADEFQKIVSAEPLASNLADQGASWEFTLDGDEQAAARLLTKLVRAGVVMSSFHRKTRTLEDVFMKVGAKEVS
jgi:ABC-2 type transport system ATP-binding protein